LGLTTQVVEGLSEIDLGLFEGLTAGEARAKYPVLWAERGLDLVNTKVPGGESYAQLSVRVLPALDKALTANAQAAKIMIVAHRAVIQVIIARATGLPMEETVKLPIPYGGMEIIEGG
jgi:probable phosphoglycerate mutase